MKNERVTVQGPVKKPPMDYMSHGGGAGGRPADRETEAVDFLMKDGAGGILGPGRSLLNGVLGPPGRAPTSAVTGCVLSVNRHPLGSCRVNVVSQPLAAVG